MIWNVYKLAGNDKYYEICKALKAARNYINKSKRKHKMKSQIAMPCVRFKPEVRIRVNHFNTVLEI